MAKVKTATFIGTKYSIELEPIDGVCVTPNEPLKIYIVEGVKNTQICLETCVHEALHACFPRMTEKVVAVLGQKIAKNLWKRKYRLISSRKKYSGEGIGAAVQTSFLQVSSIKSGGQGRQAVRDIARFIRRLGFQEKK